MIRRIALGAYATGLAQYNRSETAPPSRVFCKKASSCPVQQRHTGVVHDKVSHTRELSDLAPELTMIKFLM